MPHIERVRLVRYTLGGKRVSASTPGATKSSSLSPKWYGVGVPGFPPRKRVPLARNKAAAQRMLDDLVRAHERGAAGLPDAAALSRPLAEWVAEFAGDVALGLAGRKGARRAPSPKASAAATQYARAVFLDGLDYSSAADFSPGTAREVAGLLKLRTAGDDPPWSAQTAEHHLKGARRFCRWLAAKVPRVRADCLDAVAGLDARNRRTYTRRAATTPELNALLAAALASKAVYWELTGRDRHAIYLCAATTGYRAGELLALKPPSFELDSANPAAVLPGSATKNGEPARQPIPAALVPFWREYLAGRDPSAPVWPTPSRDGWGAKALRRDLAEAGVPAQTPAGRLDFHALRHSYLTALAEGGESMLVVQRLARHSDPRLTANTYAHLSDSGLAGAVGRLALPGGAAAEPGAPTAGQLAALVLVLGAALSAILGAGLTPAAPEPPP